MKCLQCNKHKPPIGWDVCLLCAHKDGPILTINLWIWVWVLVACGVVIAVMW